MSENVREQFVLLPQLLAAHLNLTIIALGAGIVISLPLAVALVRMRVLRYPVMTGAGVIQTIPSLALLALMVPLLERTNGFGLGLGSFGFWPAVIALTLYCVFPILRNTVTGILGVDSSLIEAARGMGMSSTQRLWQVELPLAAPVIIAGIRTAAVWVVGIATLATPVGQKCLGDYIFTGLSTQNWTMVMFGVVAAAALAVVIDSIIGGLQKAAAERRRKLGIATSTALVLLIVVGLTAPFALSHFQPQRGVHIGAKNFTEQYILAALIEQTLDHAAFDTQKTDNLGSNIIFDQLASGNIDVYVDYSGTLWANQLKREESASSTHVLEVVTAYVSREHGVLCLGPLGFENAYALAMRRDRAEELGITSLADLARHASDMEIAGSYEFFGRPEWLALREGYGLNFREQTRFDPTLMYQAVAAGDVDVVSAFSSDGRIAAYDLVVLEDPKQVIPPYDAVILLSKSAAGDKQLIKALRPLLNSITPERMQEANLMVDRDTDKKTPSEAAKWLLTR